MTNQEPKYQKYKRRLVGDPVVVGEYTMQPVAEVTGGYMVAKGETGEGGGGWVRVSPLEVIVTKGEDAPYPVSTTTETQEAMKGIALGGLAVAALCWLIILGAKIFRVNKEKGT